MEPMSIQEIIQAVGGRVLGEPPQLDLEVPRVETDSRTIHPGSLFIPRGGERLDGHAYINSALEGGAAGCLTQRERESYLPGKFYIKVDSTQRALRDLAKYYKRKFPIPIVALTGSVGKTTTKDMVAAVLGERFHVLKTEGNLNNDVGVPMTLLRLNHTHQIAVLELGMNHAGEIDYLSELVEPDVALITNVGDSHIEFFGSRENIFKAKSEIFHHTKPHCFAVLKSGAYPRLGGAHGLSHPDGHGGGGALRTHRTGAHRWGAPLRPHQDADEYPPPPGGHHHSQRHLQRQPPVHAGGGGGAGQH